MTQTQRRVMAVMTFTGMGLVLLTHLVRPILVNPPAWLAFTLGVLPNFGAGLGIPSVLMIAGEFLTNRLNLVFVMRTALVAASLISLVGLYLWEFSGGTIDPFDLAASAVAILISLILLLVTSNSNI